MNPTINRNANSNEKSAVSPDVETIIAVSSRLTANRSLSPVHLAMGAASSAPAVDAMVEVSDADAAWETAKKLGVKVRKEIGDTPYGARLFEVEVNGLRVGFLTYARKPGESRGMEGKLDGRGKRFALVVSRFNSFITERLLDGALQALRQCGTADSDVTIAHVPGAFEIPAATRQLAQTGKFDAIICLGCLLRGDTLHYEVIANEVTRGVGQSALETGVPHAFGVLTCDTLEQAIDRAGLKMGNKGFEAALAAVEMASLKAAIGFQASAVSKKQIPRSARNDKAMRRSSKKRK